MFGVVGKLKNWKLGGVLEEFQRKTALEFRFSVVCAFNWVFDDFLEGGLL